MKLLESPQPGVKRVLGVDLNLGALKTAGPRYWAFVSLLLTVLFVGVMSYVSAMTNGGAAMAMRDSYPWGLWFTNYMYYIGLSAGGLAVYASVHLFGAKQFAPLSRLAVLQAGVLVMMALLGIVTDMERPARAIWMLLTPNPTSPFVYTGSAANIYMIICFIDLWVLITGIGGHKLAHRMTLIALPFAVYLHTTTAFVLVMNKSRELWNTAMLVPIFLTSATASGIALLLISAYIMKTFKVLELTSAMFRSLATLLATVIIIDLFLLVVEIGVVYWPTSAKPGHTARFNPFLFGEYAKFFLPVLILGITAFALLAGRKTRHLPAIQITASAFYVFAIFLKRYVLMSMGFATNTLGQYTKPYAPSLTEVGLALGILSIGLLIVTAGAKILPLAVPHDEHSEEYAPETAPIGQAAAAATAEPAAEPVLEVG